MKRLTEKELKRCPFCGAEAELKQWKDSFYIQCSASPYDCGVAPTTHWSGLRGDVIEFWNDRADNE